MTPLLILLFGDHPTTAVGTDLLFAASTTGCCSRASQETRPSPDAAFRAIDDNGGGPRFGYENDTRQSYKCSD
jgi:hypothetical protein